MWTGLGDIVLLSVLRATPACLMRLQWGGDSPTREGGRWQLQASLLERGLAGYNQAGDVQQPGEGNKAMRKAGAINFRVVFICVTVMTALCS